MKLDLMIYPSFKGMWISDVTRSENGRDTDNYSIDTERASCFEVGVELYGSSEKTEGGLNIGGVEFKVSDGKTSVFTERLAAHGELKVDFCDADGNVYPCCPMVAKNGKLSITGLDCAEILELVRELEDLKIKLASSGGISVSPISQILGI